MMVLCILQISVRRHGILCKVKQRHSRKQLQGVSRAGVVTSFTAVMLLSLGAARQRLPRWRGCGRSGVGEDSGSFAPSGGADPASVGAGSAFPDPADLPAAASAYNGRLSQSLRPPAHPQSAICAGGKREPRPATRRRPSSGPFPGLFQLRLMRRRGSRGRRTRRGHNGSDAEVRMARGGGMQAQARHRGRRPGDVRGVRPRLPTKRRRDGIGCVPGGSGG